MNTIWWPRLKKKEKGKGALRRSEKGCELLDGTGTGERSGGGIRKGLLSVTSMQDQKEKKE